MSMGGILRDLKSCTLEVQEKKTIGSCIVDVCVCVCAFFLLQNADCLWILFGYVFLLLSYTSMFGCDEVPSGKI